MKIFNQPTPAFGPYDAVAFSVVADTSTPARLTAVAVEDAIRRDVLETGVFIDADGVELLRRVGEPNKVPFTDLELLTKAGTTFTHNHPGDGSFSLEDYENALFAGVYELRAVSPGFRHILRFEGQMPSRAGLQQLAAHWVGALSAQVHESHKVDQLHPLWIQVELQHLFWSRAARRFGFTYVREKS